MKMKKIIREERTSDTLTILRIGFYTGSALVASGLAFQAVREAYNAVKDVMFSLNELKK